MIKPLLTRGIALTILSLSASLPAFSQEEEATPEKPRKVYPMYTDGLHVEGSVIYTYVDDTHTRRMTLDLYKPESPGKDLPVIVMYFGGGWQNGRPGVFAALAQGLAQKGYVVVVPEYRLSREAQFPAAVHDCKAAVRWVRSSARKFGMDTDHIAVMGGSAGGHLAGFVAATNGMEEFEGEGDHRDKSSEVQAAIVMCGPMDFTADGIAERIQESIQEDTVDPYRLFMGDDPQTVVTASPVTHLDADMPPALFIDGSKDRPRERYTTFWKKMDELGIHHEFVEMDGAPHPFWVMHPWYHPTIEATDAFLRKVWEM